MARPPTIFKRSANLLLQYISMADEGVRPSLAEASAVKLYAAQAAMEVTLEAVQVFVVEADLGLA